MSDSTPTEQNPVRLQSIAMLSADSPFLDNWCDRGLCVGADPDTFFPSHGAPGTEAMNLCTDCPVREDCLEYATEADEFGIWGGLDQGERRNRRRKQRRRQASARTISGTTATPRATGDAA
jgi:WhiB family redox-sensing transcriptional regulator